MEFEEKREMIYKVLELALCGKLNKMQKKQLYDIANNISNKTNIQFERFVLYYNLKEGEKRYRLCDLAKKYNCTSTAIRISVSRMRSFLVNHIDDKKIYIIKNILNDEKNNK